MRTNSDGELEHPVAQTGHFEATAMSDQIQLADLADTSSRGDVPISRIELPMTVKDAARFLGVSSQTVYLWVERRRIPHLRVMGRNIRFLKSDLQLFRAVSPRGGECHDRVNMTVFCIDGRRVLYGGCATAKKADSDGLNQRGASNGRMRIKNYASALPLAIRMSLRSFERVNSFRSENGRTFFCRTIRSRHSAKQRPIKRICER